ncbi:MAG: hypothetical protein RRE78_01715 [Acidianus sp.]|nr:hypothetical protein [Acidianus sp.]
MDKLKLKDLKSPKQEIRQKAWEEVIDIIKSGYYSNLLENRGFFRSLLWFPLQGVRDDAWNHLEVYKMLTIEGIERTLVANSDKIKISAWEHVEELLKYELVPKDIIISSRYSFWRLLRSYYPTIRKKAWKLFPKLVELGIIQPSDKDRYCEFLSHKKPSVRIYAWKYSLELIKQGFITKENILNQIKYLEELSTKESNIKKIAVKILSELK